MGNLVRKVNYKWRNGKSHNLVSWMSRLNLRHLSSSAFDLYLRKRASIRPRILTRRDIGSRITGISFDYVKALDRLAAFDERASTGGNWDFRSRTSVCLWPPGGTISDIAEPLLVRTSNHLLVFFLSYLAETHIVRLNPARLGSSRATHSCDTPRGDPPSEFKAYRLMRSHPDGLEWSVNRSSTLMTNVGFLAVPAAFKL